MQANQSSVLTLDTLLHSYYPAVVRLALSILDDGSRAAMDEAEDAAQETFIAAARALDGYRGEASPRTWLFTIAIHQCRSRLRRRRVQRALANALADVQRVFTAVEDPERRAEQSERDAQLWAAVDDLDEKHRLPVLLYYVHDLSIREMAQILGVSEGTLHSRLHYARQRLARQLRRLSVFQEVGP